jgi:hypothetical protein
MGAVSVRGEPREDVDAWFRDRGYGVVVEEDDAGTFWANLTRLSNGRVVAPLYGRGDTADDAALSAKRRYEIEQ